jgi:hypothetical protein
VHNQSSKPFKPPYFRTYVHIGQGEGRNVKRKT